LKERRFEAFFEQSNRMEPGGEDITMNYMKHPKNQILLTTLKSKIGMGSAPDAYEQ
jgi:hypothetical protein